LISSALILPGSNYVHYFYLWLRNGDPKFTTLGILISALHEHYSSFTFVSCPFHWDYAAIYTMVLLCYLWHDFLRFNNLPCNVSMCSGSVGPFFDMILLQCCKIYSCWLMLMFMLKCCERKILFHGWKIVLNKLKRKMVIQSLLPWVFWYLLCILVLFITFVSCSFHSDHAAMCYLHHDVAMLSLDWLFKVQRSAM
jgi:hypothetical protein